MADNFDSYVPEMVATRRKFHARPELGWTEFETTATVITRLRALGYQVLCGTQVVKPEAVLGRDEKLVAAAIERAKSAGVSDDLLSEMGGYTGAVGILDTGRPGPTLAFRFDMDALPIQELQDPAVHLPAKEGFASAVISALNAIRTKSVSVTTCSSRPSSLMWTSRGWSPTRARLRKRAAARCLPPRTPR